MNNTLRQRRKRFSSLHPIALRTEARVLRLEKIWILLLLAHVWQLLRQYARGDRRAVRRAPSGVLVGAVGALLGNAEAGNALELAEHGGVLGLLHGRVAVVDRFERI